MGKQRAHGIALAFQYLQKMSALVKEQAGNVPFAIDLRGPAMPAGRSAASALMPC
jgi:hypothetical protein